MVSNKEVMLVYRDAIRELYSIAGIPIPDLFDPEKESVAIANAIRENTINEIREIITSVPKTYPAPLR